MLKTSLGSVRYDFFKLSFVILAVGRCVNLIMEKKETTIFEMVKKKKSFKNHS